MKNLKLSAKLMLGFGVMGLMALCLGALGYYGAVSSGRDISRLGEGSVPQVENIMNLMEMAERVRGSLRSLGIPGLPEETRQRQYAHITKAREECARDWKELEASAMSPTAAGLWKQLGPAWEAWRTESDKFIAMSHELDKKGIADPVDLGRHLEQFSKDHYSLTQRVLHMLFLNAENFAGGDDHHGCNAGKWLPTFKTSNPDLNREVQAIGEPHRRFHEAVGKIRRLVVEGKRDQAEASYKDQMLPAMSEVFQHFATMLQVSNAAMELHERTEAQLFGPISEKQLVVTKLLDQIVDAIIHETDGAVHEATSRGNFIKLLTLAAMALSAILGLVLGFVVTRSITRPIQRVIAGLTEGSQQVAAASGQVATASQSLAEGSAQQAASVEETSASMEEMSSMTKQNAANAEQANSLAKDASSQVAQANQAMAELTRAMAEISKAGEDTGKIIKTIDEIAFQTNLLALNAAVEAARAGEAGAGFAVVAEEVRNLAMRAAEAAKNTAGLIEGTIKKTKEGSDLVRQTNDAFHIVAEQANKVAELVGDIAAASAEQAQGIDQVNKAMGEMDKVTQQNAANAEESASASAELSAQAETMNGYVGDLVNVVGTAKDGAKQGAPANGRKIERRETRALPSPAAFRPAASQAKRGANQAIPLDDDFRDF